MKKQKNFYELIFIKFAFFISLFKIYSNFTSNFTFIEFISKNYRAGAFAFNSNKDMVIEYSYGDYRLFFGLKKNGKPFFMKNGSEIYTKEIQTKNKTSITNFNRYESENIFISLIGSSNKEYLLSISAYYLAELHDLESDSDKNYIIIDSKNCFNNGIYTKVFPLLSDESNKNYFIIYLSSQNNKNINIAKFSFSDFNFNASSHKKTYVEIDNNVEMRGIDGFIMNDKIITFFLKEDKKYYIRIYNFNLGLYYNDCNNNIYIGDGNFNEYKHFFYKGLHIKDELIAFIYYIKQDYNALELKIGNIDYNNRTFINIFKISFNDYKFEYHHLLNDFIKVTDERLAYIGVTCNDFSKFNILLFDLYNNSNMIIRKYNLNLNNKYKINKELAAAIYNGYIVLSATIINYNESSNIDDDHKRYSILMMFGYLNGTDREFDINEYFTDNYINNSKNIISNLTENLVIENNIFGYIILDQIKLSIIPDELLFYNNDTTLKLLANEDILNKDYILKQNKMIIKYDKYYYLDYQNILTEPEYKDFNSTTKEVIYYHQEGRTFVDQDIYYSQKTFYGRQNILKFKLCHEFCSSCYEYGLSNDSQKCISCLPNYQYGFPYDNSSNCVPSGHFYDKKEGKLKICNNTNSKFYFNKTSGKKICFNIDSNCPYEYPFYNNSSKECINLTIPTTIPTAIPTTIITTIPTIINLPTNKNKINTFSSNKNIFNISKESDIKINITKEELIAILTDIIDSIEIGENYNIKGNDFNLVIKPTNSSFLENNTHVNFKNCENILREQLKIDESSMITFLQLEIYDKNSQSLINKVEYQAYNDNKTLLDLNICYNTNIEIIHSLKDGSYNFSEYDNFMKDGIDIFDINDGFFNDICHPFSDSKMI